MEGPPRRPAASVERRSVQGRSRHHQDDEEGAEVEGEEGTVGKDDSSETKKEEDSDGKEQKSKEEKQK